MKRTIALRADGGPEIGLGHFMRAIALAEMLHDSFHCVFYTKDPSPFQISQMEAVCQHWVALPDDYAHLEAFLQELRGDEIVVLDNYYFETDYQLTLKEKGCKLVCIDDLHDKHYVADAVINHAEGLDPSSFSCEAYTHLYLGLKYAMLRQEFLDEASGIVRNPRQVMVCMGGSIQQELLDKIIIALSRIEEELDFYIIANGDLSIPEDANQGAKFHFSSGLSSAEMRSLMLQSTLALLPASTIALESIACRLPGIIGYYAPNQQYLYEGIRANGLALTAGDLNVLDPDTLAGLIVSLWKDEVRRKYIVEKQKLHLDLKSPGRIKDLFLALANE